MQVQNDKQHPQKRRVALKIIGTLCLLTATLAVAWYWLSNPPKAERRGKPKDKAYLVSAMTVEPSTHRMTVDAMGRVEAVDKVDLSARVSGRITEVNADLTPGSFLSNGATLVTIDQIDYRLALDEAEAAYGEAKLLVEERELAIAERKSEVVKAETELILEKARRDVARSEYELLTEEIKQPEAPLLPSSPDSNIQKPSSDAEGLSSPIFDSWPTRISKHEQGLILREPQLKSARAALQAAKDRKNSAEKAYKRAIQARRKAKAALEKAELALDRTTVEVPFNAVVQAKNVGPGDYVTPGKPLATLVNTASYWITLLVPRDQLKWLDIPHSKNDDRGSKVRVNLSSGWDKEQHRYGRIVKLKPEVEKNGRMAQVVVEVQDPRSLTDGNEDKPVLLLDSFVDARIQGKELSNVVKVPREALHSDNHVWILTPQNKLAIKKVAVKARTPQNVFVSAGLQQGNKLITSDISTPVEGMKLRETNGAGRPSSGRGEKKNKK